MDDNGNLYPIYDVSYVEKMKKLVALSNYTTPNLTEACFLTGRDFGKIVKKNGEKGYLAEVGEIFKDFCKETGASNAIITGVVMDELVGNVVIDDDGVKFVTNERTDINYSGTGDIFSSVVTGALANGESLADACRMASVFVVGCLARTQCKDRRFGIEFQRNLACLLKY